MFKLQLCRREQNKFLRTTSVKMYGERNANIKRRSQSVILSFSVLYFSPTLTRILLTSYKLVIFEKKL